MTRIYVDGNQNGTIVERILNQNETQMVQVKRTQTKMTRK